MNIARALLNVSLLCGVTIISNTALAVAIQVDYRSNVEITTNSGVASHNENSPNSVNSYVSNGDSFSAVVGGNGNNVINADAFLSPSVQGTSDYKNTKISATFSQKAIITNSLSDADVSFDYLIAAGHLSNIFRSGLGVRDDYESLSIEFCADILLNGTAIWSTKTGILQNKDHKNLLTKTGVDLNVDIASGGEQGFYSWSENFGRLNLGTIKAGEVFELEYVVGVLVNGNLKNCGGDALLCEEERLFNTASEVRFGHGDMANGMKMDASTIVAKYVPESSAWSLMLISLLALFMKFYRRYF